MGKRGPKPGFKQERAKAAAAGEAQAPKAAAKKRAAASPIPDAQQPTAPAAPVAQAAPVVSPPADPPPPPPAPPAPPKASKAPLSASDRENPNKLSGKPLRELAHRRGLAKSSLPTMSDEKIREQLRYMTHRQYDDAVD